MVFEKKRIYRYEFNKILKTIPEISREEREYLNRVFSNELVDGLTEFELRQKIQKLKANTTDSIDGFEAEKVKRKLLEALGKNF